MPGLISVDDHVVEPANLFTDYGSSIYSGRYPFRGTVVVAGKTTTGWVFDNRFYSLSEAATKAGEPWGQGAIFQPSSLDPGVLASPLERLVSMDEDGIDVSLCYPSFMGLGGETMAKHPEVDSVVRLACVDAYNRWLSEEWAGYAPRRFIKAGIVPLWEPGLLPAAVEQLAKQGFHGVLFPQAPDQIGLPPVWDRSWTPFFKACEDAELVVCQHTLSDDMARYTNTTLPPYLPLTLARTSGIETLSSWLLTPALNATPRLKVMIAESGLGWIPWFIDLADQSARLHSHEFGRMRVLPSERLDQHFGLSILGSEEGVPFDRFTQGVQARIMFEADYPHLDGSYPWSRAAFDNLGIPDRMKPGIARVNAMAFFHFYDAYDGTKEAA